MKKSTQKRKLISVFLFVLMTINLLSPVALATGGVSEIVRAKPLVIMMEYQDYKFSDIDTKEGWRLRGIPGDEYTPEFVQELLFGDGYYTGEDGQQFMSVREYYNQITAGAYHFEGQVVGPYTAKHEAAYYGSDRNEDGSDQDEAMLLVREAIQAVAQDPNVDLEEFDVENRTGDGQFGVSDGVIDTVIVIHPGIGEEWGGGSLGEDAIWPFRCGFTWYQENNFEIEKVVDHSGKEWGFDDFVLIAQDSASDMLCHEHGHVLGLPDLYGFSGSYPPVEWWCIMGGSYTGKDIAGTMPNSYGAYCREFLQKSFEERKVENPKWANYDEEDFLNIGEYGLNLELHQAHERLDGTTDLFRIDLPEKETVITIPTSGEYAYFSGNDNDSRNYMKTTIDLTDYKKAKLEFKAWYKIDPYFDFATVRVNEVGSEEWETVEGNITTTEFDEWLMENETEEERLERNPGHGITADSEGWVDGEFDLGKYVGKEIELTFYFWSDGNTPEQGIYIDDIVISGVEKGKDETEEAEEVETTGIADSEVLREPGGEGSEEEIEITGTVDPEEGEATGTEESAEPNEIELNKKTEGTFTEEDYTHRYNLTLTEDKTLNIVAKYGEGLEGTWVLYDEDGVSVAWANGISNISAGTYNLAIWATGDNKAGNYSLMVSEEPKDSEGSEDSEETWITIFEDDADGEPKFDLSGGFTQSTGVIHSDHYYLLEWRNTEEGKVDEGLAHVYYGWPEISYDPGLLVWYVNEMWVTPYGRPDQQTADHPGECFAGVVDADQNPIVYDYKDGNTYEDTRGDFSMHDAAFSLRMENKFYHDWGGGTITKDIHPFMVPEFYDNKDYTNPINTEAGLILPNYGLKILVTEESSDRSSAKVHIMNSELGGNPVDYSDGLNVKDIRVEGNTLIVEAENNGSNDNLGEKAYIGYINNHGVEAKEELELENGVYKCSTDFLMKVEKGTYQVNFIVLEDAEGNARAIYNSKVHYGYGMDLSSGTIDNENLTPAKKLVEITNIKALDKNGVEKTEFERGNTVLINTTLDVLDEVDSAVIIIEVQDKNGVPYALRYVPFDKAITEYSLGFSTYGLEKGQNNVNVYVWDNINDKNALSETKTFIFTVK